MDNPPQRTSGITMLGGGVVLKTSLAVVAALLAIFITPWTTSLWKTTVPVVIVNVTYPNSGLTVGYSGVYEFDETVSPLNPNRSAALVFYGVPYARSPVGERRLRNPVSLKSISGSSDEEQAELAQRGNRANGFCVQGHRYVGDTRGVGVEDCLTLNIYTPLPQPDDSPAALESPTSSPITGTTGASGSAPSQPTAKSTLSRPTSSLLPVFVYFHGGGFHYGAPKNFPFSHWVHQATKDGEEIIFVNVHYRLSVLGFLPGYSGDGDGSGNWGLEDQVEALRWVNENIEAFGGDKSRVTIAGNSAGGASVFYHLIAQYYREQAGQGKLFHRAILQSAYRPPVVSAQERKYLFNFIVDAVGCSHAAKGWFSWFTFQSYKDRKKLACMREKDTQALFDAAHDAQAFNTTWRILHSSIHGLTPTDHILQSHFSRVPLLIGHTTDESFAGDGELGHELRQWYPHISDGEVSKLEDVYTDTKGSREGKKEVVSDVLGDVLLKCVGELFANQMPASVPSSAPIYYYRFNQPAPRSPGSTPPEEVDHAAENFWMHKGTLTGGDGTTTFVPFQDESEKAFSREVIEYWMEFARGQEPWKSYNSEVKSGDRMVLQKRDGGSRMEVVSEAEKARCHTGFQVARGLQN